MYPGKRMAGRMGGNQHTVQNLQVLRVDPEMGVVLVKGLLWHTSVLSRTVTKPFRSCFWTKRVCCGASGCHQEADAGGMIAQYFGLLLRHCMPPLTTATQRRTSAAPPAGIRSLHINC